MRVVLVDDNDEIQRLVAEILSEAGHEIVAEANDGPTGIRAALAHRPDLVIMDWQMPGMDGIEATRRIRAEDSGIAILAFTSTSDPSVHDAFLEAGALLCLDKARMAGGLLRAVRDTEHARATEAVRPDTN